MYYQFFVKINEGEWVGLGSAIDDYYEDDQAAFMTLRKHISLRDRIGRRKAVTIDGYEVKWIAIAKN